MTRFSRASANEFAAAHPTAITIAAYSVVVVAASVAAFFALFTQFATYDDEGTLLVTLQAFSHGDTLYRDVITAYGPFYYEFFGGLFALTEYAINTNVSRLIVLVIWVSTSLFFGLATQRLTGFLVLGVTGMITAFGALAVLANEPMHPQGLCVLLLGVFLLLAIGEAGRRVALVGGSCGAVLAALTLTKINLGAFAVAALILAAVLTIEPIHRRRWLRWPVIAVFLMTPVAIMVRDLGQGWVRDMIALEILAMIAILVAAWPASPTPGENTTALSRWMRAAIVGFVATFIAILGILMLTGPTPTDMYEGIVGQAIEIRDLLLTQIVISPTAVNWGIVSVGAAVVATRLRSGGSQEPTIWPGLFRLVVGLVIWLSVARVAPLTFSSSPGNQVALPLVLAWVAAIPPMGARETPYRRFLRILLPALAVVETLQVYPVAGSQVGIAALFFVPVGALCLADALTCLRVWGATRGAEMRDRIATVVGVVTFSLAGIFAYSSIMQPAASDAVFYHHETKLTIPGATLMRLTASEVQTYTGVVDLLHRYRCTSFIGYPSVDSLYLWSEIEVPPTQVPGTWVKALNRQQQQSVVDALRASPRPCAVKSEQRAFNWLHGESPPPGPLVSYVFDNFKPVAISGDFQFLLPKERAVKARPVQ